MRIELREALKAHRLAAHTASPVAERAALVATELAGNALRHGRSPAVVRLLRVDSRFILDVADQDRESIPEPAAGAHTDHGGRGLHIARSLAGELSWYTTEHCSCRECHPGRSSSMIVFVENAAEAVTSMDAQVGEPVRVGDRVG
jgi:anti-sigma regulatory factor (Ser/Thr protein kinase)